MRELATENVDVRLSKDGDKSDVNLSADKMTDTNTEELMPDKIEPEPPKMQLRISSDKMAAYFRVKLGAPDQTIDPNDIVEYLKENDVVYGIQMEAIKDFCEAKRFFTDLTCAKGTAPTDGIDGRIEYNFEQIFTAKPKEREDGTVDYYDLGIIQSVKEGDVLCTIIPRVDGINGTDVLGAPIKFAAGHQPQFPAGANTKVSTENEYQLVAAIDGCIDYKNLIISVTDVFIVSKDVDNSSGNINFSGTVVVYGDVREGFFINAGKDVVVSGMVEGASIEAGGNITIKTGMNGMGRGRLKSGGEVVGKFFENTLINSVGDVTAETFMNCNVTTSSSIIAKGRMRSALIGGTYTAEKSIYSNMIGTENYYATTVTIDSAFFKPVGEEAKTIADLKNTKVDLIDDTDRISRQMTLLSSTPEKIVQNKSFLDLLMKRKGLMRGKIAKIDAVLESKKQNLGQMADYKIVAIQRAFPGVKVRIGPYVMNLEQEFSNSKFYADENGIVFAPVSPADKLS